MKCSLFLLPFIPLLGPRWGRNINLELLRDRGRSARCYGSYIPSCGSSRGLFFCGWRQLLAVGEDEEDGWTRTRGWKGALKIGNKKLDSRPARNSLFWSFLAVLMEIRASETTEKKREE